jgi:hypothetical protein
MFPVLVAMAKHHSHATDNPDGRIEIHLDDLARACCVTRGRAGSALEQLTDADLVRVTAAKVGTLAITLNGFAKWQTPRMSRAERKALADFEKKCRENTSQGGAPVAEGSRSGGAQVTPDIDLDIDLDKDLDETKEPSSPSVPKDDTPRRLFEHWLTATSRNPNQNRLTKKRRGMVRARLADGYTEDQLRTAIDGIAGSAWHAGGNPDGTRYDTFQFIFRDGENVEKGIERAVSAANRAAAGTQVQAFSTNPRHAVSEEYDDGIQWHDNTQPAA